MGWHEVFVLVGGFLPYGLETGPHRPEVPGLDAAGVEEIAPDALAGLLAEGKTGGKTGGAAGTPAVLDLASSPEYRAGHIPGAWFAIRAELSEALRRAGSPAHVVLTSPDGVLARLAAPEARAAGVGTVQVLRGGTDAWRAAGQPLGEGAERMASDPTDVFPKPYHRAGGVEQAMREYLTWEVALVEQLSREGDVDFRVFS
jgi:rhodanese-related sulfurtransferase